MISVKHLLVAVDPILLYRLLAGLRKAIGLSQLVGLRYSCVLRQLVVLVLSNVLEFLAFNLLPKRVCFFVIEESMSDYDYDVV